MIKWVKHEQYWELIAPQKDDIWLEGRKCRVTSTSCSGMAGQSPFKTVEQQANIISGKEKEEFSEKTLKIMENGTINEGPTRDWAAKHFNLEIVERGLVVPLFDLELGGSVDGDIIGTDGIIEIKCPVKMYSPILGYMEKIQKGWKPPPDYHEHIYFTHYFQMIHNMKIMGKKFCIYIVNSVSEGIIFTQVVKYDEDHWNKYYPIIKENYNKYVRPHLNGKYPIIPN